MSSSSSSGIKSGLRDNPSCNALAGVKARRWRVGDFESLSTGLACLLVGGRAPYSAVLNEDLSWSSKLARCLSRQCKRICAKAETSQRRVSSNNVPFSVEKSECLFKKGIP